LKFALNSVSGFIEPHYFVNVMKDKGELETFKAHQVDLIESLLGTLTADMADPEKRKKASLNNVAYAYDRIFNALRLIKGESTVNIETAHHFEKDLQQIESEIKEIESQEIEGESEEERIDREISELEQDIQ
jgi:septal ring factor EnvC (AmiA/AmiB activator)